MKYKVFEIEFLGKVDSNIITTSDNENFVSFPAQLDNPNYDAFLVSAKLTDEEVHALEPDVWYDFPAPVEEVVLPVEAPVVEAPVVEAPVVEAPVVEVPVEEVPVEEVPVEEAPVEELAAAE